MARVTVLGAGRQGAICALDLLEEAGIGEVTLADQRFDAIPAALKSHLGDRLRLERIDARDPGSLARAVAGRDAVACALPYGFNLVALRAAVAAGAHFCDLGGKTEIVRRQMELDQEARALGLSAIPDCGLAPGLVNVLAAEGIRRLDRARSVRLLVGGLPLRPRPPLNYEIVYSLRGVLDYYTTPATILRDGKRIEVDALSEVEEVEFPRPLGRLEAFHTAGGASTMPAKWEGRLDVFEYKTLRYPGHAAVMRAIRDLGLLEEEPLVVGGVAVAPREVFIAAVEPRLAPGQAGDLVVLRAEVVGELRGQEARLAWEMLVTAVGGEGPGAMAEVTGRSLAIVVNLQLDGRIQHRGVATPDEAIPAAAYLEELARRGLKVVATAEPG